MAPLALFLAVLLLPSAARANNPHAQAQDASLVPVSGSDAGVRDGAGRPFDGNSAEENEVVGRDGSGRARLAKAGPAQRPVKTEPPSGSDSNNNTGGKVGTGLLLAGAAALGALQGGLAAGAVGALAGGVLGLGAAWLFHKGDYGGAFGVTAGAIVGTAFGGPIGGIIGAVVGGIVGHFLGKLFL